MTSTLQHFQMRMNGTLQAKNFYEYVFGWTVERVAPGSNLYNIKQGSEIIGELVRPPATRPSAIIPFYKVASKSAAVSTAVDAHGVPEDPAISVSIKSIYAVIDDASQCTFGVFQ